MDDFIQINDINPYTPADVMPAATKRMTTKAHSADTQIQWGMEPYTHATRHPLTAHWADL